MKDIVKHCDDNLGGIYVYRVAIVDDIQSMSEPIDGKVLEPIVLKTGKVFYDIYATEGSTKFSEDSTESSHGDYYKAKLSSFVPKDRTEVTDTLNKMANKKFIIDYTDNNSHRKLIGTIANPMQFRNSLATGEKVPNPNGHTIEFYGDLLEKSPTYFV